MRDILPIRPAAVGDMETIIGLIDEAAAWLPSKGTDQWAQPWPSEAARDARVRRGLRDRRTWIVEDHGIPVATATYRQNGNQKLWTPLEQREPAVYLSRLIVARKYAGYEIGAALVDWAGQRGLWGWNAQWTRIDVWTTNVALHNYYEKRGFRWIRTCDLKEPDRYPSAALFQKPTAEIDPESASLFTELPNSDGSLLTAEP